MPYRPKHNAKPMKFFEEKYQKIFVTLCWHGCLRHIESMEYEEKMEK